MRIEEPVANIVLMFLCYVPTTIVDSCIRQNSQRALPVAEDREFLHIATGIFPFIDPFFTQNKTRDSDRSKNWNYKSRLTSILVRGAPLIVCRGRNAV